MEQAIRMYGDFLLEGIVVIILIIGVFWGIRDENGNQGIWLMTGANISVQNQDYTAYRDFQEVYKAESEKTAPVVNYVGGHLETGLVRLADHIVVMDYAGNVLPMRVISIKSAGGRECLAQYIPETTEMFFERAGVYTIEIEAMDEEARVTRCCLSVPINQQ